jgi:acyl carrier protein
MVIIMNLKKYNEVFVNVFEVEEAALNEDFKFGEAPNWDSLAHMELIAQLEDAFEIMFDTADIIHFGSYENGKKILIKYDVNI